MKKAIGRWVRRLFWRLTRRKTRFHHVLYKAATVFRETYGDVGDYPAWNGEHHLLRSVAPLGFQVIFDVGANVGDWTASALETNPGAIVHAFELSQRTAERLATRFASEARVVTNPFGLSDTEMEISFREFPDDPRFNSLLLEPTHTEMPGVLATGRVMRGDDYCRSRAIERIDFLKVDAEGCDDAVVAGFSGLFSARAVRLVQFEYNYAVVARRFLLADFAKFFAGHGYRVAQLRSTGIQPASYRPTWNNFDSCWNYVAFREDDAELRRACEASSSFI